MGLSRYKISYKCDCGVDYGDCGVKCAWILCVNRSVDVNHLFHVDTHRYMGASEENPKIEQVFCMGDSALKALNILLGSNHTEDLTDFERATCIPGGGTDK